MSLVIPLDVLLQTSHMVKDLFNKFRRTNAVAASDESQPRAMDEDENDHQWDRPIEFVFSLISNSVGLGNVWRFPYLAAKNGGGAFLIPYFILYFLIGAPIYYLELGLGQFASRGPSKAFKLARGWQGVGFAMIINSVFCMLYYNVIISWALFYFIASFRTNLLWKQCNNTWNDDTCFVSGQGNSSYQSDGTISNQTGRSTAAEQLFYKLLLGKSERFEDFGSPQLYATLSLFVAWILVGLAIIRGVKSSGKVAYFTAIFPYIVLLILIIQSATLDGAAEGIKFYGIPRWELVANFQTWKAAASQVFFSLGLSFGSLLAYAASNKFQNNFYRQMCIVVSCDCFTGVFAGFAVFATIGYLAKELNETVETYAQSSGPGLAFITYPEAIGRMPGSPFFAILFFLMLLALGLGSQFALTDVPITSIIELFPQYKIRRPVAVVVTCIVSFLISLPFTCPGGIYLFELLNEYAANVSMLVVGFFEVFVITYIYGFNRFMKDVEMMLGRRAGEYYLFLTWGITAPLLILIITVLNLVESKPLSNGPGAGFEAYTYPEWSTILGWFIFISCIIPIPLVFLIKYIEQYRSVNTQTSVVGKPRYLMALTETNAPEHEWGPKRRAERTGDYAYLNNVRIEQHYLDDAPLSTNIQTNPAYEKDDNSAS